MLCYNDALIPVELVYNNEHGLNLRNRITYICIICYYMKVRLYNVILFSPNGVTVWFKLTDCAAREMWVLTPAKYKQLFKTLKPISLTHVFDKNNFLSITITQAFVQRAFRRVSYLVLYDDIIARLCYLTVNVSSIKHTRLKSV